QLVHFRGGPEGVNDRTASIEGSDSGLVSLRGTCAQRSSGDPGPECECPESHCPDGPPPQPPCDQSHREPRSFVGRSKGTARQRCAGRSRKLLVLVSRSDSTTTSARRSPQFPRRCSPAA